MEEQLLDAVRRGDTAEVARLLTSAPSLVTARMGNVPAILLALYHGHEDVARAFVAHGATLSLHEAAALGDAERVAQLLDADPPALDRRSDDGFPPLGLAIFFRRPHVAKLLIERGADVSMPSANAQHVAPLHAAAAVCDCDTARLLLARGADPNARQQNDFTPLHGAASRGDLEFAKLLVAHGADRNARTADGKSVADVARERAQPAFAEWIETIAS
jgi:ankyrin repeat protein